MKKHRKKRYRNGIRVNSNRKRIISLAMVWVLCLMLLPTSAFAAEDSGAAIGTGGLCAHHTEHDDTCGYVEGSAESPCTHEHSEDCYTEVKSCIHEHTSDCYPASDSSIPEDGTTSSEGESVGDTTPSDDKSVEDTTPSDDESGKDATPPPKLQSLPRAAMYAARKAAVSSRSWTAIMNIMPSAGMYRLWRDSPAPMSVPCAA